MKNSYSFLQRKRVEEEKEEESPKVTKTYEGGNTGAKEVDEMEEMKGDKEENVTGGRKVTISFLLYFLQIVLCNIIMQN